MSESPSGQSSGSSTRQRKRKRVRSVSAEEQSRIHGKRMFWIVCALVVAATAFTTHRLRVASLMGGVLMPGMSEAEVRYLRGAPQASVRGGTSWIYPDSDTANSVVRFTPDMKVRSISCFGVAGLPTGCADILGITLGTTEDHLVNRLGPPSDTTYIHNGKILVFSDLGLAFTMREYKVATITKVQRGGGLDFLPRVAWYLLP